MGINCCKQSFSTVSDCIQVPNSAPESKRKAVLSKTPTRAHTITLKITQNQLYQKRKNHTTKKEYLPTLSESFVYVN
ncbi:unnamed protein product [Blepharisma stoltei]|uniref:Uncharacterized protein n=1 Tax=Blepharisma stoltei TaxID=1481888 RepID=A0AAU9ITA4_9CILI|nr:unnamed protein product [Blepharisma stoltei]